MFGKFKQWYFTLPLFLQAAGILVGAVFLYGLLVPSMVSANSTPAVWIGIALIFVGGYLLWLLSEPVREIIFNSDKDEEKDS